jgi:DNA-binding GntR family transcriptional regulator
MLVANASKTERRRRTTEMARARPRRPRQREAAYDRIKSDILQCVLKPGTEVSETQLVQRYRLGRASVRAALLRLGQEGFVQAFPRRGHIVTTVTVKDVHAMFEFRLLLEPAVARLAAGKVSEEDILELKRLQQADCQTGLAFNRSNTDFHLAIARILGNERIVQTLRPLHEQIERLVCLELGPVDLARGDAEHARIIDALAAGDGSAAERAMAEHIANATRDFLESVHASPGVMAAQVYSR